MKKNVLMTACCMLMLGCCLTGCKDDEESKIPLTGITVNSAALTLAVGDRQTIVATPVPEDATDVQFTWTSKDPAIATVNSAGEVEAKAVSATGTDIEVSCGKIVATVHVTVEAAVVALQDIEIEKSDGTLLDELTLAMRVGEPAVEFTAKPVPANSTQTEFTWASDNTAVASVLYLTGRIAAKSPGTANITVTETASQKHKTIAVTVGKRIATGITPNKTSDLLRVGEEAQYTATPVPADADDEFVWTSDNTGVLTVNSETGLATAVSAGAAKIIVANKEETASAEINVTVIPTDVIALVAPADGADLLIYDEAPDYRFQWLPVAGIPGYTVKIATTAAGLATTPMAFDVGDVDHRDVTIAECKSMLDAFGITDDGNEHTLYWTVIPTGVSTPGDEVRSVKVSWPNIPPKPWNWAGASGTGGVGNDCDGWNCDKPAVSPNNTMDGDLTTYWQSIWVKWPLHRIAFNFAKECTVSKVTIHSNGLYPRTIQFRTTLGGVETVLGPFTFASGSGLLSREFVIDPPVQTTTLTIDITETDNAQGPVRINEVDVE
jgi:uncharacterized protein YjdB